MLLLDKMTSIHPLRRISFITVPQLVIYKVKDHKEVAIQIS